MVSRLQDTHVLRVSKRAQAEAGRLDEDQCVSYLHHVVQAGDPGPSEFSAQEVAVPDSGRGSKHQEFQVATVATATEFRHRTVSKLYFLH